MSYALGYSGLGQQRAVVAGPINGIATLRRDVQISARNAAQVYGSELQYDSQAFRALLRQFKDNPEGMTGTRLEPAQVRNFVIGVITECVSAVAAAEQLAALRTHGPAQRAENHRGQGELIGAARIMLDGCNTMLQQVVPVRGATPGAASGLGALPVAVIVAVAVVAVIVGIAAVITIALVADAMNRMIQARATARRICEEAEGGCTAEQYADIVAQLQVGPFDSLARGGAAALAQTGAGVATTMVIVGAGALALGGLWFLFGTQAGQRTLAGMRGARKREATA